MIKPSTNKNIFAYYQKIGNNKSFMSKAAYAAFGMAATGIGWISKKTGLSYPTVNILVFYLIVPATITLLLDNKTDVISASSGSLPILTFLLFSFWGGILFVTGSKFYSWCDFRYNKSVSQMLQFRHVGWRYEEKAAFFYLLLPAVLITLISII